MQRSGHSFSRSSCGRVQFSSSHLSLPILHGSKSDRYAVIQASSVSEHTCELVLASEDSELRALAFLRATSFYEYPKDRSEFSQRSHCRMKADEEWRALEQKLLGKEVGWERSVVVPLLVLLPNDPECAISQAALSSLPDLSAQVPPTSPGEPPWVPVAGLDINIGVNLPAEDLVGKLPKEHASTQRAYLSNVCVAEGARRQGLARFLVNKSVSIAADKAVRHVYVHVEASNIGARALYEACGCQVETEEDADSARKRQHERRLLLGKSTVL